MRFSNYLILVMFGLFIISCNNDNPPPVIDINVNTGINLRDISEGQKATYVMYKSQCDGDFEFTGDTLHAEVIKKNDSLYLYESFSKGSHLQSSSEHLIIAKDSYVLIPERFNSQMLFFYGNDTIFMDRQPTAQLKQKGCILFIDENQFIGNEIGIISEFKFGQIRISDRKSISCVPGSFLGIDAYILYEDYLNLIHIVDGGTTVRGFIAI